MRTSVILGAAILVASCGGGDSGPVDAGGLADAAPGCDRSDAATDRTRYMVVSRPYTTGQDNLFVVLEVATDGALGATANTFNMGRTVDGRIAFTRDGEVGLVAQEDGTLGVFRLDAGGVPTVVHAGFDAGGELDFWASSVVVGPESRHAYVLNSQWRENGGGVYRLAIGCDGSLTNLELVAPARLPDGLIARDATHAVVAAEDFAELQTPGYDAFLVDLTSGTAVAGGDVFGDDEAIVGSTALTGDGRWFLIGDTNSFSTIAGNRVGVAEVTATGVTGVQVLSNLEDPYAMVASPFDNTALVVSGFGDAIFRLDYDSASPAAPFSNAGELTYSGPAPQLPGAAVMIDRGTLRGLVFVAENQGVRRVRFEGGGGVTDLGLTDFGTGSEYIVGAIGVQP